MSPPERAIVLCVAEMGQVQAPDRAQPLLPVRPGKGERPTHDYVRNRTTSLFAALKVATGEVIGRCHRRHRHREFPKFLDELDSKLTGAGRFCTRLEQPDGGNIRARTVVGGHDLITATSNHATPKSRA